MHCDLWRNMGMEKFEAEMLAVQNGEFGPWLESLGILELLGAVEDLGAETPIDLLFLDQVDVDAFDPLVWSPEQRTTLMAAVDRIRDFESGEASAEGAGAGAAGVHETAGMKVEVEQPWSQSAVLAQPQSLPQMDGPQKKGLRAPAAPAPAQPTPDGLAAPEAEGEGQSPEQEQEQEPEQRPDPTVAPPEQGPPKSKTLSKTEPKPGGKIHRVDPQVDPAV